MNTKKYTKPDVNYTLFERDKRNPPYDWRGHDLDKKVLNNLQVGDQVRLGIDYVDTKGWLNIYFEIVKIEYLKKELNKPRKFYGRPLDIYLDYDEMGGFKDTDIIEFKKINVKEVPGWKTKNNKLIQPNKKEYIKCNKYIKAVHGYNEAKIYYKRNPDKEYYNETFDLFLDKDIIKEYVEDEELWRKINRENEKKSIEDED